MKKKLFAALIPACLLWACSPAEPAASAQPPASSDSSISETPSASLEEPAASESPASQAGQSEALDSQADTAQIDGDRALALALENASVPAEDVTNVKVERDRDNAIPVFDVEFETRYGDYDFQISMETGEIVEADYEVDEEALDSLGGSPLSLEEARALVQSKVPGAPLEEIQIWEEGDDGRTRYEGELFFNRQKFEFEIDPQTGRIFDWNADLRL